MHAFLTRVSGCPILSDSCMILSRGSVRICVSYHLYWPVKCNSIFCAIFAALREYLYAFIPFAWVDVDLTVFAINLFLHTHAPMAHVQTMLNATSLDPRLSSNFDTQLRFDCAHDLFAWCFAPSIWKKPSSYCLKGSDRSSKIILYLHNAGQNRITQSIYEVWV